MAVVLLTMAAVTTATVTIYYNYVATVVATAAASPPGSDSASAAASASGASAGRRDRDAVVLGRSVGSNRSRREEYIVCETRDFRSLQHHPVSAFLPIVGGARPPVLYFPIAFSPLPK